MESLIRFFFGLPPRPKDIEEIRKAIPELFELSDTRIDHRSFHIHFLLFDSNPELLEELRRWIGSVELEKSRSGHVEDCPNPDCPMKHIGQSASETNAEVGYLQYLVAGGGPDAKPPKEMFFDLVRKSKKKIGAVKEVILTDPYIYLDKSEDGISGGFNVLAGYLSALGLSKKSPFTLKVNPSPRKATKKSQKLLNRKLKTEYPNILLGQYSSKCKFHDRFYIVRDDKGKLGGVFGPSLNSLNSTAIVLMGDIEGMQLLKKLSEWL